MGHTITSQLLRQALTVLSGVVKQRVGKKVARLCDIGQLPSHPVL